MTRQDPIRTAGSGQAWYDKVRSNYTDMVRLDVLWSGEMGPGLSRQGAIMLTWRDRGDAMRFVPTR